VVALILLPPIAFASPPDPLWIAGIYDSADGDDIVTLIYETAATNAAALSKIAQLPCLPRISLKSIAHGFPGGLFTRVCAADEHRFRRALGAPFLLGTERRGDEGMTRDAVQAQVE
jgi:hypothetical protein